MDQQLVLEGGTGGEIGMAPFGRERDVAPAVPEEPGLAQPRAGGNDSGIPRGGRPEGLSTAAGPVTCLERQRVLVAELAEPPGVRLEIVQEPGHRQAQQRREARRLDHPGQVGRDADAVLHRAGDAEGGTLDRRRDLAQEARDDLLEVAMLAAWV